jgi:hypothetical protein
MANNVFKVGTADDSLSIQEGPFAVGAAGLGDYGPTSRTGYYAGIDVPEGGYVFYQPDGNGSFNINVAHDDTQAMFFLRSYGATGTTLNEMLSWASASGSVVGLSEDITTSEIIEFVTGSTSGSSGSAGTSGTSGSGGGSSQFPKAWVVQSIPYSNMNCNDIFNASNTIIYTRSTDNPFTIGTEIYLDPALTELSFGQRAMDGSPLNSRVLNFRSNVTNLIYWVGSGGKVDYISSCNQFSASVSTDPYIASTGTTYQTIYLDNYTTDNNGNYNTLKVSTEQYILNFAYETNPLPKDVYIGINGFNDLYQVSDNNGTLLRINNGKLFYSINQLNIKIDNPSDGIAPCDNPSTIGYVLGLIDGDGFYIYSNAELTTPLSNVTFIHSPIIDNPISYWKTYTTDSNGFGTQMFGDINCN